MRLQELDYHLPEERIAQEPARPRDSSRLLVLHRKDGTLEDRIFPDVLEYLSPADCLVMNDTRVIPARLFATIGDKACELLLLRQETEEIWHTMIKPGKRAKEGTVLCFPENVKGVILGRTPEGNHRIQFMLDGAQSSCTIAMREALQKIGAPPLPPYITAPLRRPEDYQTVYAQNPGSVAAPTAGLHFTPQILEELQRRLKAVCTLTLHIGPATFRPIRSEVIAEHPMPPEQFTLSAETAQTINKVKKEGGRVIAVGTSTCRVLESCVDETGILHPKEGDTSLFIQPDFTFRAVDILLTNFHLPKSTNLLLVSSFAGKEKTFHAYRHAVEQHYRFYSFGDAMLIL